VDIFLKVFTSPMARQRQRPVVYAEDRRIEFHKLEIQNTKTDNDNNPDKNNEMFGAAKVAMDSVICKEDGVKICTTRYNDIDFSSMNDQIERKSRYSAYNLLNTITNNLHINLIRSALP